MTPRGVSAQLLRAVAGLVAVVVLAALAAGPSAADLTGPASSGSSRSVAQDAKTAGLDGPDLPDLPDVNPLDDGWENLQDALGNLQNTLGDIGESLDSTAEALSDLSQFDPRDWPEELAKEAAESAVRMMGQATDFMERAHRPAWSADWWRTQYAVMLPIGLVLFAFVLIVVMAKLGGARRDPVAAIELMRDTFPRAWFAPAVMVMAPAFMAFIYGFTDGLTQVFSNQAENSSGSAMETATKKIGDLGSDVPGGEAFGQLGGALAAFFLLVLVILFMIGILFQLMVATWGVNILTLFIPVVLAMWIYPPWRRRIAGIATLVLGLMLAPAFIHLVYWSFWSAADSTVGGESGDTIGAVLYVIVAGFMLSAAPVTAAWLIPKVVPEAGAASPGGAGAHAAAQDSASNANSRVRSRQRRNEENRGSQSESSSGEDKKRGRGRKPTTGDAESSGTSASRQGQSPAGEGRPQGQGESGSGDGGGTRGMAHQAGEAGHDGAATVNAPGSGGEGDGASKAAGGQQAPTKSEGDQTAARTRSGGQGGPGEKAGNAGEGAGKGAGKAGGPLGMAAGAAAAVAAYTYERTKNETRGNASQFMSDTDKDAR